MERKTDEIVLSLSSKRTIREINRGPRFCIISRRENRGGNPERYNTRFLRGTLAKAIESNIFHGFSFLFYSRCCVPARQRVNFSRSSEGREGDRRRECLGNCPDPDEIPFLLPFPSFFQAGRYRDESKTSPVNSRPQDPRTRRFGRDKILPRYKISGWAASPLPLPLSPFLPLPPPRCTWLQAGRTSWTRR